MVNIFRIIGVIAILAGIAIAGIGLAPVVQGQPFALLGSFLVTQAVAAITAGIIALGFGHLIAVSQRVAENTAGLLDYIRNQDGEGAEAPAANSGRDVFADVPDYSPRRDPPIVKEGVYRDHTVLTLEDGTVAVQTTSGWKRFRRIRDFDRLLTA
jgi:hypothetical protein